jgi:hypothetical protein
MSATEVVASYNKKKYTYFTSVRVTSKYNGVFGGMLAPAPVQL